MHEIGKTRPFAMADEIALIVQRGLPVARRSPMENTYEAKRHRYR